MSADGWELLVVVVGVLASLGMLGWALRRWHEHKVYCCTGQCATKQNQRVWLPRQRAGGNR